MSRPTYDIESLDQALRGAFRGAKLPAAPGSLRTEVDSLATTPRTTTTRRPQRGGELSPQWHRSPVAVGLLAAAAVIALVAVGLPLLRTQPQPAATPSPTSTPTSSLAPTLRPTPGPAASDGSSITDDGPSIAWTSVPMAQFKSGTFVVTAAAAAQVGGTIVVAGNERYTDTDERPVLLVSTNGVDWSRLSIDYGGEFAQAKLWFLVPIPGGLLLVGASSAPDPLCDHTTAVCTERHSALLWQSSDGRNWHLLPAASTAPFADVLVVTIASGPKGLVAFGSRYPAVNGAANGYSEEVVLHSTDGLSWSSKVLSNPFHAQQVVATAGGFVELTNPGFQGKAWYSSDGLTWTATQMTDQNYGSVYVAAGNAGMVATNGAVAGRELWVSGDGKTWQTASTSPFTSVNGWLAGDGNQILAISGSSACWSADGKNWHRGSSSPAMPDAAPDTNTRGVAGLSWILGSTVIAVSNDRRSIYVGHIAAGN
jgi:hypothetical protein